MTYTTRELHHTAAGRPVVVSIVSHGQVRLVEKLLANLDRTSADLIAKVVVTCNVPEPHALSEGAWSFPLELIDNPAPKGFGANHNAAFERCDASWFLVLNPDIEFAADPLPPLLDAVTPATGLLAPAVLEPGKSQPEPNRRLLTPWEILLRRLKLGSPPAEPEWVAGMFMLVRSAAYAQVKGFDERYFMYVEDADLCARLRLAGWRIQLRPDVCVVHDAQRASRRNWRPLGWHLASLARWWVSKAFWGYLARRNGLANLPPPNLM